MGFFRSQFLKVIAWEDDSKNVLVYRFPMDGKEIMKNSKLTVRESQNAVFVHKGQIADVFEPGYYTLGTANVPFLTKLASWKYAFESPIKAEVYFVNMRQFTNQKWGTTNPIIVRDKDFDMARIRGFGTYSFKVDRPDIFMKELFGTSSTFKTEDIAEQLKSMLVSCLADVIAESKVPLLDIAANTLEFNELVKNTINEKFKEFGLKLCSFTIENISVPESVEKMLDERSSVGVMSGRLNEYVQMQSVQAMRDAAKNPSGIAGMGVGMGAGLGFGQMYAQQMNNMNNNNNNSGGNNGAENVEKIKCEKCGALMKPNAKFCPECGEKVVKNNLTTCPECGASMKPNAKFCPECGKSMKVAALNVCPECGAKVKPNAQFCGECGYKL